MASFEIKGLKELQQKLNRMGRKAQELDKKEMQAYDILTPEFFRKRTSFPNLKAFMAAGGFNVNSQEDLLHLPAKEVDELVASKTNFSSWADMMSQAGADYASKEIFGD